MQYGANIICHTLEKLGARTVFGMPGTQNVNLYEALRSSSLRSIVTTNEMAAAFAANGYYRASGEVGVLFTIPGPGFTYALSGLAEALLDSAAVLHITSTTGDGSSRSFQHQYLEMSQIARPLVKKVFEITEIDRLAEGIAEGYYLAASGEPGPVLVIFDKKLYQEFSAISGLPKMVVPTAMERAAVDEVVRQIASAGKIAIFAGQGAQEASTQVIEFAEKLGAAVLTTNSGRGVIPETDQKSLYYDYSSGGGTAVNEFIADCDLVIGLGCKLSHNGTGGFSLRIPPEKFIQVDTSASTLNSNYPSSLALQLSVSTFLSGLLQMLPRRGKDNGWDNQTLVGWREKFNQEQSSRLTNIPQIMAGTPVPCPDFFEALQQAAQGRYRVVTDSGLHQVLTRGFLKIQSPRGLITPADFQSMGFAIPAAIGAQAASPDHQTIVIIGDGGMAISGLELLTAVREKMNLCVIVFNDGYLNLIRMQQLGGGLKETAVQLTNPDFALLANSIGAGYFTIGDNLEDSIKACLQTSGVNILEVFLTDSASLSKTRMKGIIKRQVRKVLRPSLMHWLKAKLRS